MDPLRHKIAIAETLYLMARATDELDTELLESLFIPGQTVMIDVSKHLGYPPQNVLPEKAAEQTIHAIAGFTATHHLITNPVITLDPNDSRRATATAYKTAYHCIEESSGEILSATARGKWEMELELYEDRWRIQSFTVVRTVPLLPSELNLWSLAKTRMTEGKGRLRKSDI